MHAPAIVRIHLITVATVPTMEQSILMARERCETPSRDCIVMRTIKIFSNTKKVTADAAEGNNVQGIYNMAIGQAACWDGNRSLIAAIS